MTRADAAPPIFAASTPRETARRMLVRAFADQGLPSAELDARLLTCAALGVDHATLVRDPSSPLGASADALGRFAARRLEREPVSRIIGHREFWGAPFALGPAALDPRGDTETLVEAVLEHIGSDVDRPWRLLDLGVGSGAILGALLLSLPNASGVGVDVSAAACIVARNNLAANGLSGRAQIICSDWASSIGGRFDVIVSNPPYIPTGDIGGLAPEVLLFDPRLALDGGADGLTAYREVVPAAERLLVPGGLLALEFGFGQRAAVESLLSGEIFKQPRLKRDLGGRERVLSALRAKTVVAV